MAILTSLHLVNTYSQWKSALEDDLWPHDTLYYKTFLISPRLHTGRQAAYWGQSNTSFVSLYSTCKSPATLMAQTPSTKMHPWKKPLLKKCLETFKWWRCQKWVCGSLSPQKSLSKYNILITENTTMNKSCLNTSQICNYCPPQQLLLEGLYIPPPQKSTLNNYLCHTGKRANPWIKLSLHCSTLNHLLIGQFTVLSGWCI